MLGLLHKSHTGSCLSSNILHFDCDPSLWDADIFKHLQLTLSTLIEYTHSPSNYAPNK
jgi:hypothetical protein